MRLWEWYQLWLHSTLKNCNNRGPKRLNRLLAMCPVQCHRSANRLVFRLPKGQITKSCDWRHSLWASTGHLRCTPGSLVGSHLFVIFINDPPGAILKMTNQHRLECWWHQAVPYYFNNGRLIPGVIIESNTKPF